ncbi:MAG: hypothetical protein WC763_01395 [Candidatus Paceibacterota bacterium]|jgi:hypothetical protein
MKKAFMGAVVLSLLAVMATPFAVLAANANTGSVSACGQLEFGAENLVNCIIGFFDYFVYLVVALSVVYVVIGAFKMLSSEEKREEGKKTIYYGVIGLFVMMSIWGFVNILDNTFRLSQDADSVDIPTLIPD